MMRRHLSPIQVDLLILVTYLFFVALAKVAWSDVMVGKFGMLDLTYFELFEVAFIYHVLSGRTLDVLKRRDL